MADVDGCIHEIRSLLQNKNNESADSEEPGKDSTVRYLASAPSKFELVQFCLNTSQFVLI